MEDVLLRKTYHCKANSGLSSDRKPMVGLTVQTVNFFQDETKFNRRTELEFSTKPAILPNCC
jgi:hypothetical protein